MTYYSIQVHVQCSETSADKSSRKVDRNKCIALILVMYSQQHMRVTCRIKSDHAMYRIIAKAFICLSPGEFANNFGHSPGEAYASAIASRAVSKECARALFGAAPTPRCLTLRVRGPMASFSPKRGELHVNIT